MLGECLKSTSLKVVSHEYSVLTIERSILEKFSQNFVPTTESERERERESTMKPRNKII